MALAGLADAYSLDPQPFDALTVGWSVACVFGAAIVRGYSGFGFSLLSITAIALLLPPAQIVPAILMLEVAASIHMLPAIRRDVQWRSIGLLLAGCAVATPLGVWLLANVPEAPMRVALASVVAGAALLLLRGATALRPPGTAATLMTGVGSGALNGAFGIGGLPVALFFLGSPAAAAAGRASLVAYFLGTDTIALAFLWGEGLVGRADLLRFALLLPPLLAGIWIGARSFGTSNPAAFRVWVLRLLVLLAALTGVQGIRELVG